MTDRTPPAPTAAPGKLRRQCTVAALGAVIAVGAAAWLAHMASERLAAHLSSIFDHAAPRAAACARAALDLVSCRRADEHLEAALDPPGAPAAAWQAWTDAAENLRHSLCLLSENASQTERARIDQWRSDTDAYCDVVNRLADQAAAGNAPKPGEFRRRLQSHRARLDALAEQADDLATAALGQILQRRPAIDRLMAWRARLVDAGGIVSVLLLAAAVLWIFRAVLERVNVVSDAFGRLAEGNLKTRLSCNSSDEIGLLARRFNALASALDQRCRQQHAAESTAAAGGGATGAARAGAPRKVLVAEDGPENRRFMAMVLQRAGVHVSLAENGQEAVDKARVQLQTGTPFDMVIMDMQMPMMDGREAALRLRQEGHTCPIIAVTGHDERYDKQACLEAGCDRYIQKPLDRDTLLGLLTLDGRPCQAAGDR